MTTQNFSIEDLAISLIGRLDRRNIFPPYYNNPEALISSSNSALNSLSLKRPRRSPNAFLLCRKNVHQEAKRKGTCNMRVISKVTGILWRNASSEEKGVYERLADRVNELHCKRVNYRESGVSSLPKNKNVSNYSIPSQVNAAILNTPLLPASYPTSIPQTSINNSSILNQKDELFLNNSNNYFNSSMSELNNQIIPSSHNNENHLLSYIYNNYLTSPAPPQNFSHL